MINIGHSDGSILRCDCPQCLASWEHQRVIIPNAPAHVPDTEFMMRLIEAMSKPLPEPKRLVRRHGGREEWVWEGRSLPEPILGVSRRFPNPFYLKNGRGGFTSMHLFGSDGPELDPTKRVRP